MTKISWKAGTLLAPVPPALISCGTMEKPNVMTAAWTGIICTEPTLVYVSIRPSRYSHKLISDTKEFVINVPTVSLAKAVDLCGVKSGEKEDKFELSGLTAAKSSVVDAPQVAESPISLECRVKEITPMGTHDMFLAEVVAVDIDDAYLDDNKALHLEKAGLLAYAHGFYYALGEQLGKFGWSVEKPETVKKREKAEKAESENNDTDKERKPRFARGDKPRFGDKKTRFSKDDKPRFGDKKSRFSKDDKPRFGDKKSRFSKDDKPRFGDKKSRFSKDDKPRFGDKKTRFAKGANSPKRGFSESSKKSEAPTIRKPRKTLHLSADKADK